MLIRTIVAAAPLLLGAGQAEPSDSSQAKQEEQQPSGSRMGDSVEGHGQSSGALGNSSDTTGAKGQGGVGTNSGTAGKREDQTAAGEKGDTTSGARSGRWDESGGKSADASGSSAPGEHGGARGHAHDRTLTGKLSQLSDDRVTIQSPKGERHELKIVPQTRFTISGKDAPRGQLAEGQEVRASYMEHGADRIAVRIDAGGGGSKAGGTAEPKKQNANQGEKQREKP